MVDNILCVADDTLHKLLKDDLFDYLLIVISAYSCAVLVKLFLFKKLMLLLFSSESFSSLSLLRSEKSSIKFSMCSSVIGTSGCSMWYFINSRGVNLVVLLCWLDKILVASPFIVVKFKFWPAKIIPITNT